MTIMIFLIYMKFLLILIIKRFSSHVVVGYVKVSEAEYEDFEALFRPRLKEGHYIPDPNYFEKT
jgi:hypothetical protein